MITGKERLEMKRMSVTGLCLVAVLAVGAVASVSASAETFPNYKVCAKAAKVGKHYTGLYNDKGCSEVNATHEGKYELEGISHATKLTFTGKSGASVLDSYVEGVGVVASVTCKKSTASGEISGEATADLVTTFAGCSSSGEPCASTGAKKGEIVTDPLTATLVTLKEETKTEPVVIGVDVAGTGHRRICLRGAARHHDRIRARRRERERQRGQQDPDQHLRRQRSRRERLRPRRRRSAGRTHPDQHHQRPRQLQGGRAVHAGSQDQRDHHRTPAKRTVRMPVRTSPLGARQMLRC
jgi:hypothetical protein